MLPGRTLHRRGSAAELHLSEESRISCQRECLAGRLNLLNNFFHKEKKNVINVSIIVRVSFNAHTYSFISMESKQNKEIGDKIKVFRAKQGLTQGALAGKCDNSLHNTDQD